MTTEMAISSSEMTHSIAADQSIAVDSVPARFQDFARCLSSVDQFARLLSDLGGDAGVELIPDIRNVVVDIIDNLRNIPERSNVEEEELKAELELEKRKVIDLNSEVNNLRDTVDVMREENKSLMVRLEEHGENVGVQDLNAVQLELETIRKRYDEDINAYKTTVAELQSDFESKAGKFEVVDQINTGNHDEILRLQALVETQEAEFAAGTIKLHKEIAALQKAELLSQLDFVEEEKRGFIDEYEARLNAKTKELEGLKEELREADKLYTVAIQSRGGDKENSTSKSSQKASLNTSTNSPLPNITVPVLDSSVRPSLDDTFADEKTGESFELNRLVHESLLSILQEVYNTSNEFVRSFKVELNEEKVQKAREQRNVVGKLMNTLKETKESGGKPLNINFTADIYKQLQDIATTMKKIKIPPSLPPKKR